MGIFLCVFKKHLYTLAGVAQGTEHRLQTKGLPIQFPVRVQAWAAGRFPVGATWEATAHWCFSPSPSLSLPFSLKINKNLKKKKASSILLWPRSEPDHLRFQHTTELQGLPIITGTTGPPLFLLEFYNLSLKHSCELPEALVRAERRHRYRSSPLGLKLNNVIIAFCQLCEPKAILILFKVSALFLFPEQ